MDGDVLLERADQILEELHRQIVSIDRGAERDENRIGFHLAESRTVQFRAPLTQKPQPLVGSAPFIVGEVVRRPRECIDRGNVRPHPAGEQP